jgi:hypothetical protein
MGILLLQWVQVTLCWVEHKAPWISSTRSLSSFSCHAFSQERFVTKCHDSAACRKPAQNGPQGIRSLLIEMHTMWFNTLQLQYLEAIFECLSGQELGETNQATIHSYMLSMIPDFGDFGDPQSYTGFIPSEHYLSEIMNKCIEQDEGDANQHTACLVVNQIAIDDSHKVLFLRVLWI